MATDLSICNLALAHIGHGLTVSSISPPDASVAAESAAQFYPQAFARFLDDAQPSYAVRTIALALLDTDETPSPFDYTYAMPSQCLRMLAVVEDGTTDYTDRPEFVQAILEDGTPCIHTKVEDAMGRYIYSAVDVSNLRPVEVDAVSRLLASYLAGPIIKGAEGIKVSQAHLELYEKVYLPRAAARDGNSRQLKLFNDFVPDGLAARA